MERDRFLSIQQPTDVTTGRKTHRMTMEGSKAFWDKQAQALIS
jgi:hypothetical protein